MHRVVKNLVSVLGATVMMVSTAVPAFASWTTPDYGDLCSGLVNITTEITKVTILPVLLDKNKIKVVYIEDVLNNDQVTVIKNSLNNVVTQNNILTLQNVLNFKNVLNGLSVLTFGDFLSNNNATLKDVIAVHVLDNGNVLVFCCH